MCARVVARLSLEHPEVQHPAPPQERDRPETVDHARDHEHGEDKAVVYEKHRAEHQEAESAVKRMSITCPVRKVSPPGGGLRCAGAGRPRVSCRRIPWGGGAVSRRNPTRATRSPSSTSAAARAAWKKSVRVRPLTMASSPSRINHTNPMSRLRIPVSTICWVRKED